QICFYTKGVSNSGGIIHTSINIQHDREVTHVASPENARLRTAINTSFTFVPVDPVTIRALWLRRYPAESLSASAELAASTSSTVSELTIAPAAPELPSSPSLARLAIVQ